MLISYGIIFSGIIARLAKRTVQHGGCGLRSGIDKHYSEEGNESNFQNLWTFPTIRVVKRNLKVGDHPRCRVT